jgi:MFS family permease
MRLVPAPVRRAVADYRPFLPLFDGLFLCFLGIGAALAVLPFSVTDRLHGGKVEVGVVIAAMALTVVIVRPYAGRAADRIGCRPVMLAGAGLCAAAGLCYHGAGSVPVLVAVRVLHGLGEGTLFTAGASWLVTLAPPERKGRIVGLYGIHMWLGMSVGAILGTVLMRHAGFSTVWTTCAVLAAAGTGVIALKAAPPKPPAVKKQSLLPRSVLVPGLTLSMASLGYAGFAVFAALELADRGVGGGIAAFDAYGFTYVGVRLFLGGWPDRLGPARVAAWSAVLEAAGLALVSAAADLPVAILGGLLMGAGLSLLYPSLALVVLNRTETAYQGAALGAFTSFWDLGVVAGGPVAGLIVKAAGYPAMFLVLAACALASGALSLAEWVSARPREEGGPDLAPGRPGTPAALAALDPAASD